MTFKDFLFMQFIQKLSSSFYKINTRTRKKYFL